MKLIDVQEVTKILGCSKKHFYYLKKRYPSAFDCYMGDGNKNLYDLCQVQAFKATPKNKRQKFNQK